MTAVRPPRLACWLLERFSNSWRADALIGDLAEQFSEGRSRSWYWLQTAGTLVVDLRRATYAHGLTATAALMIGCALMSLGERSSALVFRAIYGSLGEVSRNPWTAEGMLTFLTLLAKTASNCTLCLASCWVVTRIHRPHPRAALVAFAIALTAQHLPAIGRLVLAASDDSRFAGSLATELVITSITGVFSLAEGLWVIRTKRSAEMNRRTRIAAVLVVTLVLISTVLYAARRIGAVSYSLPEGCLLDAVVLAGGAYLVVRLWRETRYLRGTGAYCDRTGAREGQS